jgi:hypothetical protein
VTTTPAMSDPLDEKAPAARASARPWDAALVCGIFAVCLIRLAGFVHDNAVDVLFNDQWDALWPLLEGRGPWAAFLQQHGPPRMGLGGVLNWFLYGATGWDVRAEAWVGVAVLTLATGVALALAARLRGRLAWTDAAFPLLLLSPLHWETLTFTIFVGAKILPLLLVLLVAWAWSTDRCVARTVGVGVCGTLALFTGYGFCSAPATIGLALLLWLRPEKNGAFGGRTPATVVLLIMSAALAWFASGYQWSPGTSNWRFPMPNWWDYPRFCALMFTNLLGWRAISIASVAAGGLLLALVLGAFLATTIAIWRRQATGRTRAAWFLTGTTLAYAALAAVGRLPTSLEAAFLWRYISLLMPALCGLALVAEEWAGTRGPRWRLGFGVAWLALASVVWGNFTP